MVTRRDYTAEAAEACKAVLIELIHLMGEFRDHMVVVGGWVPALLFPEVQEPHASTLDIDLALDFRQIPDDSYRTILQALSARGYRQYPSQQFRFFREVKMSEREPIVIEVDLLAGEYGGDWLRPPNPANTGCTGQEGQRMRPRLFRAGAGFTGS